MTIATDPSINRRGDPQVRRWTRDQYQCLGAEDYFHNDAVELVNGVIVQMAPESPLHAIMVGQVRNIVSKAFATDRHWIREQLPLGLGSESEPGPDLSIVEGEPFDYLDRGHPTTAALVIEISLTTLAFDKGPKSELYARFGLPEYWIVDLVNSLIEFRRQPNVVTGAYDDTHTYSRGHKLGLLTAPAAEIPVDLLLPRRNP